MIKGQRKKIDKGGYNLNVEKYLSGFFRGTKNPSLKAMEFLMSEFGHPENSVKSIHIAGTNGKGSVTEMIANVLTKAGYTVGKFISPHLIHYNERISVNNINITDSEMENLINKISPVIEKYNLENEIPVTLFELETTMAFLYFKEKKCDFAILETGLGGLYDCTNVIKKPIASVITSIGYDHMHILGNTLTEIAYQKAGIIKENSDTVIFSSQPEVDNLFINECSKKNNSLHIVKENDIEDYHFDNNLQYFNYKEYENIAVNLKGEVQVKNASLCVEVIRILNKLGYIVDEKDMCTGLSTVVHKARFEQINTKPLIIYDGAHNEPAMRNLQKIVKMYYSNMKRVYIVSILKRKDYEKMLEILSQDKDAMFIFTSGNNSDTYTPKEELYECMQRFKTSDNIYMKELDEAIDYIFDIGDDMVNFFIGSFYTYGSVVNKIEEKNKFVIK